MKIHDYINTIRKIHVCRGIAWVFCGSLILFIHAPSLTGGFAFDDYPNLVKNSHLSEIHSLSSAWETAFTNVSGPLGRPVGMFTFALNAYFTGLNPWWMKLTNLGIHLLNTWLVFLLAVRLAPLLSRSPLNSAETRLLAVAVALIWAIQPLNLTSVAYIIQRFNSLATLFSLLAVLVYLRARMMTYPNSNAHHPPSQREGAGGRVDHGFRRLSPLPTSPRWGEGLRDLIYYGLSFLLMVVGLFAKENAVLVPIFIAVIEAFALRFASTSPFETRLLKMIAVLMLVIMAIGFLYVLIFRPGFLVGGYQGREFTLGERLLTEARIVCWYLWMIVLPNIQQMSLYHDDIVLSTGLLSPPATLFALLALLGLIAAGGWLRVRLPALGFAVFWFLGGHLLESTVIPLELAYEHRNYLPSVGVVLGLAVLLRDMLARVERRQVILGAVAILATSLFAFSTWNRSQDWSDPLLTPVVEAHHKPNSPRAQIEAGLIYNFVAKQAKNQDERSSLIQKGAEHYNRARQLQSESPNPLFGQIMLYYESGLEPPPDLLPALQTRLEHGSIDATAGGGIQVLAECWFTGPCHFSGATLANLLRGPLDNPRAPATMRGGTLFYLAKYHAEKTGDRDRAIDLLKQALALDPNANNYRMSLISLMIAQGRAAEASQELAGLIRRDSRGLYRPFIDQALNQIQKHAPQGPITP